MGTWQNYVCVLMGGCLCECVCVCVCMCLPIFENYLGQQRIIGASFVFECLPKLIPPNLINRSYCVTQSMHLSYVNSSSDNFVTNVSFPADPSTLCPFSNNSDSFCDLLYLLPCRCPSKLRHLFKQLRQFRDQYFFPCGFLHATSYFQQLRHCCDLVYFLPCRP